MYWFDYTLVNVHVHLVDFTNVRNSVSNNTAKTVWRHNTEIVAHNYMYNIARGTGSPLKELQWHFIRHQKLSPNSLWFAYCFRELLQINCVHSINTKKDPLQIELRQIRNDLTTLNCFSIHSFSASVHRPHSVFKRTWIIAQFRLGWKATTWNYTDLLGQRQRHLGRRHGFSAGIAACKSYGVFMHLSATSRFGQVSKQILRVNLFLLRWNWMFELAQFAFI